MHRNTIEFDVDFSADPIVVGPQTPGCMGCPACDDKVAKAKATVRVARDMLRDARDAMARFLADPTMERHAGVMLAEWRLRKLADGDAG